MGFDFDLNQVFEISTADADWTTDGNDASRNSDVIDNTKPRTLFPISNNEDDVDNNNDDAGNNDDANNNNNDNNDDEKDIAEQENQAREPTNQETQLPLANVTRIMRCSLPLDARVTDEAGKAVQDCVFHFIRHVTNEANEYCRRDCRVTITAEDVIQTMKNMGFDKYVEPLKEGVTSSRIPAPEPIEDQSRKSRDFVEKSQPKAPAEMQHDPIQKSGSDNQGVIGHDANKRTGADKEGAVGRDSNKKTVRVKQDVKRCDVIATYRPNKQGKMILHSTRKFRPDGKTAMYSYFSSQQDVSGSYVDDYFQGYIFLDNSSRNNTAGSDHHDQYQTWLKNNRERFM